MEVLGSLLDIVELSYNIASQTIRVLYSYELELILFRGVCRMLFYNYTRFSPDSVLKAALKFCLQLQKHMEASSLKQDHLLPPLKIQFI